MATAIVEGHDFSALAPIEHDGPLQNRAGQLLAVDQFVIPAGNVPGIPEKDSVVGHETLPASMNAFS